MAYRILWILALGGVAVVISGWWLGWWDSSNGFSIRRELTGIFSNNKGEEAGAENNGIKSFSESIESVINGGEQAVKDAVSGALQKQKESAVQKVTEVKQTVLAKTQEQASNILNSLEQATGLNLQTSQVAGNAALGIIVLARVNDPVEFIVKNNSGQIAYYLIDWGDGQEDNDSLDKQEERIVSHKWNAVGDYVVSFLSQKILVRVIN